MSVCLYVCLFVCLSVCLCAFITLQESAVHAAVLAGEEAAMSLVWYTIERGYSGQGVWRSRFAGADNIALCSSHCLTHARCCEACLFGQG